MSFDELIERVLAHEGGYVNNPDDPGGETQWGISKRTYPELDIKALTRPEAIEIYRRDFWQRVHGDELHPAVAYQALDFAVNSGVETAIRKLQAAAGVADDGHWGPVTAAAVKRQRPELVIFNYIAERQEFQARLAVFDQFGRGWSRRNAKNMRYAAADLE
jgi:lysozyme family protein